ncbi:hypothetical protein [Planctomicrobium piriforme]|uniref:Uncharacterized protein n=1 Tax=Planctomicrobium piriforme TaxID=1576369 RepID=A0A1I3PYT4_9PLAN|nr:hypothetical protein [Planctomicrobium piriforme]SFJ26773.1 hypothetical protein SAMN05421753_11784 [Planctomicrobium piriforme]
MEEPIISSREFQRELWDRLNTLPESFSSDFARLTSRQQNIIQHLVNIGLAEVQFDASVLIRSPDCDQLLRRFYAGRGTGLPALAVRDLLRQSKALHPNGETVGNVAIGEALFSYRLHSEGRLVRDQILSDDAEALWWLRRSRSTPGQIQSINAPVEGDAVAQAMPATSDNKAGMDEANGTSKRSYMTQENAEIIARQQWRLLWKSDNKSKWSQVIGCDRRQVEKLPSWREAEKKRATFAKAKGMCKNMSPSIIQACHAGDRSALASLSEALRDQLDEMQEGDRAEFLASVSDNLLE